MPVPSERTPNNIPPPSTAELARPIDEQLVELLPFVPDVTYHRRTAFRYGPGKLDFLTALTSEERTEQGVVRNLGLALPFCLESGEATDPGMNLTHLGGDTWVATFSPEYKKQQLWSLLKLMTNITLPLAITQAAGWLYRAGKMTPDDTTCPIDGLPAGVWEGLDKDLAQRGVPHHYKYTYETVLDGQTVELHAEGALPESRPDPTQPLPTPSPFVQTTTHLKVAEQFTYTRRTGVRENAYDDAYYIAASPEPFPELTDEQRADLPSTVKIIVTPTFAEPHVDPTEQRILPLTLPQPPPLPRVRLPTARYQIFFSDITGSQQLRFDTASYSRAIQEAAKLRQIELAREAGHFALTPARATDISTTLGRLVSRERNHQLFGSRRD